MLHPKLTKAGIELVKSFEGLRRKAARLDGGGWTIGYGHTASAREGAEVTAEEAEALLLYDLDNIAWEVDAMTFSPLSPNQFSALTAFAFNIGLRNLRDSAVLKRINEGAYLEAAAAIELWRRADFHGDSLVVDALVRRRAAEKALFLTPRGGFRPIPTAVVRPEFDALAVELAVQSAGLAKAGDLTVSLEGETATAELDEAPGAATTAAARNLSVRLQQLYPDADEAEVPPAEPGADSIAPTEAAPESVPAPEPEAEPEPEPPPPPLPEELAPPPRPAQPAPSQPMASQPAASTARRRYRGPSGSFAAMAGRLPSLPIRLPTSLPMPLVVMLVGLFGAVLFVGALAAMIYGAATVVNLAIGLLGVILMVPAGLKLLLKAFGERPATGSGRGV